MNKIKNIFNDVYKKGFFHLFSANSLIHLIEFGAQLFVAWILIADDIGRIKTFQSFAAIGVVLAGLGFNTSILKLCSEKDIDENKKQNLFAAAVKTTLLFSTLTILLIVLLSYFNLISQDSITNKLFVYYSLSIPLIALNNLLIAYYQALKAFKKVSFLLILARIIHVSIIISLTYLYGLKGFILGVVLGFLFSSILLLSKIKFFKQWFKTTKESYKENWGLAKYAFLGNAINMITLYLDIFFLNHLVSNQEEIGYYGFALTLISGLRIVTSTAQQFVTPFYSEFSLDIEQVLKAFKKSSLIFVSTILGLGIIAIVLVPIIINFVFSGKYNDSMYFFQMLTVAWMIRSWVSLKGPFLLAMGYIDVAFKISLTVFLLTIVPYGLFIQYFEIDGALYGQLFTATVFFIVVNIGFRQVLNKIKKN